MTDDWASSSAVKDRVRKAWDSGAVLRELNLEVAERRVFPLRIRLVGPRGESLRGDLGKASAWARRLVADAATQGWRLETRATSAGALGRQTLPFAAWVDTPEVALSLLSADHRRKAAAFADAMRAARAADCDEIAVAVALDRPHLVLAAGPDWPVLLRVVGWLLQNRCSGTLPRQIPVAGMHTKLVEQQRPLLTRLLDAALPADSVDRTAASWAERYGLAGQVRQVRLRAEGTLVGLAHLREADVTWPVSGLAGLDVSAVEEVIVVENVVSYHAVPMSPARLVIFGGGYAAADVLRALPWLGQVRLRYWGDLDTHGFAILAAVRQVASHVQSILMDEVTLLAHEDHWVAEPSPLAVDLMGLTPPEQDVYDGLRAARWGPSLRLEQEFIRFDLVLGELGPP